jgi:hypothetical protein
MLWKDEKPVFLVNIGGVKKMIWLPDVEIE